MMNWYKKAEDAEDGQEENKIIIPFSSDLICPFCNEGNFDAAGLKNHLQLGDCLVYNAVDTSGIKRMF